jgi:hypothetical protein
MRLRPGQLPVEEHGHLELRAEPVGDQQRFGARRAPRALIEVDDGQHVNGANVGMLSRQRLVVARAAHHIDTLDRNACAREQGIRQRFAPAGDREHGAMVIAVGVHVQHARVVAVSRVTAAPGRPVGPFQCLAHSGDRALIATL